MLREPGKMTEDVSQTFLGVRFNCNKCHDHPFEKVDAEPVLRVRRLLRAGRRSSEGTLGREIIRNNTGDTSLSDAEEDRLSQLRRRRSEASEDGHGGAAQSSLWRSAATRPPAEDRREAFVDWLTSKDNPLFAKSMANRVWSYFFGRGIIDPVDDIRASNPPSNPELLDALTEEFVKSGFDLQEADADDLPVAHLSACPSCRTNGTRMTGSTFRMRCRAA